MKDTARERPKAVLIPLDRLVPHPMNPNVMAPELKEKLTANTQSQRALRTP